MDPEFSKPKHTKKHGLSRLLSDLTYLTSCTQRSSSRSSRSSYFESKESVKVTHSNKDQSQVSEAGPSSSFSNFSSCCDILSINEEISQYGLQVLMECPICFRVLPLHSFSELRSCSHRACFQCLQEYIKTEITESRVNLSCPSCDEPILPSEIYTIINDEILREKYETFMLRKVLVTEPDARWCPFPDCGYAVIASGCADCPKIPCERPGCKTFFCYNCRQEWHPNQTCGTDIPRENSSIFQEKNVKACPRCKVLISKTRGTCNLMKCSVCGTQYCWLCMQEITNELHYLSSRGCVLYGKKPWSRKRKILWQIGMLIGGVPLSIALATGLALPALTFGIPIWVGLKLLSKCNRAATNKWKRNLILTSGVVSSFLVSPIIALLVVGVAVPLSVLLIYVALPAALFAEDKNDDESVEPTQDERMLLHSVVEKDSVGSSEESGSSSLVESEAELLSNNRVWFSKFKTKNRTHKKEAK